MSFPVSTRGICVKGTTKVRVTGDVGTTVPVGGVAVSAGDVVIGGGDGVVVIRRDEVETILERVRGPRRSRGGDPTPTGGGGVDDRRSGPGRSAPGGRRFLVTPE